MEKKNAYFTVEAALVLPIVIAALLFVIYMMLFQYDRCLLEQDMGAIALWGALVTLPMRRIWSGRRRGDWGNYIERNMWPGKSRS